MTNNYILYTEDLTVGYGRSTLQHQVLSNLNLRVNPGQLIAVIGANGTGKSTLLKSLAGLLPVLKGRIWLKGTNVKELTNADLARKLSVVLTDHINPGYYTVGDLVAMGRYPYTDWRGRLQENDLKATLEALRLTGLMELEQTDLHELSDGQRQKALIARALAQDGPLMLLDEPLIHLDIPSKWEIMGLLKKMTWEKQQTIILATHELELSLEMADQVWLINRNRKLIAGTPEEMVKNGVISETFDTEHYKFRKK